MRRVAGSHSVQTSKFFEVLGSEILSAIIANDLERLRLIVDSYLPSPQDISRLCTVRGTRSDGRTAEPPACPLLTAVELPDTAILRYLLEVCCFDANHTHIVSAPNRKSLDSSGKRSKTVLTTALNAAVQCGFIDAVEMLLDAGADPNVTDGNGHSPLWTAVVGAHCDITRLLVLCGADRTSQNRDTGETPLHLATALGHSQLAKTLLDDRRQATAIRTGNRSTPLQMMSNAGTLPIHIAAAAGHVHLVQLFCSVDTSIVNIRTLKRPPIKNDDDSKDKNKVVVDKTPLHLAAERGHVETVLALVNLFSADLGAVDAAGNTALHLVVSRRHRPGVDRPPEFYEVTAQTLIKYGVEIYKINDKKETPLDLAVQNGWAKISGMLRSLESAVSKEFKPAVAYNKAESGGKPEMNDKDNKKVVQQNNSSLSPLRTHRSDKGDQPPSKHFDRLPPVYETSDQIKTNLMSDTVKSGNATLIEPELSEDPDYWPPPPPQITAVLKNEVRTDSTMEGATNKSATDSIKKDVGTASSEHVPRLNIKVTGEVPKAYNRQEREAARTAFILSQPVGFERRQTNEQEKTDNGTHNGAVRLQEKNHDQPVLASNIHPFTPLVKADGEINGANRSAGLAVLLMMQPAPYKSFGTIHSKVDAIEEALKRDDDCTVLRNDKVDCLLMQADIDEDWNDEEDEETSKVTTSSQTIRTGTDQFNQTSKLQAGPTVEIQHNQQQRKLTDIDRPFITKLPVSTIVMNSRVREIQKATFEELSSEDDNQEDEDDESSLGQDSTADYLEKTCNEFNLPPLDHAEPASKTGMQVSSPSVGDKQTIFGISPKLSEDKQNKGNELAEPMPVASMHVLSSPVGDKQTMFGISPKQSEDEQNKADELAEPVPVASMQVLSPPVGDKKTMFGISPKQSEDEQNKENVLAEPVPVASMQVLSPPVGDKQTMFGSSFKQSEVEQNNENDDIKNDHFGAGVIKSPSSVVIKPTQEKPLNLVKNSPFEEKIKPRNTISFLNRVGMLRPISPLLIDDESVGSTEPVGVSNYEPVEGDKKVEEDPTDKQTRLLTRSVVEPINQNIPGHASGSDKSIVIAESITSVEVVVKHSKNKSKRNESTNLNSKVCVNDNGDIFDEPCSVDPRLDEPKLAVVNVLKQPKRKSNRSESKKPTKDHESDGGNYAQNVLVVELEQQTGPEDLEAKPSEESAKIRKKKSKKKIRSSNTDEVEPMEEQDMEPEVEESVLSTQYQYQPPSDAGEHDEDMEVNRERTKSNKKKGKLANLELVQRDEQQYDDTHLVLNSDNIETTSKSKKPSSGKKKLRSGNSSPSRRTTELVLTKFQHPDSDENLEQTVEHQPIDDLHDTLTDGFSEPKYSKPSRSLKKVQQTLPDFAASFDQNQLNCATEDSFQTKSPVGITLGSRIRKEPDNPVEEQDNLDSNYQPLNNIPLASPTQVNKENPNSIRMERKKLPRKQILGEVEAIGQELRADDRLLQAEQLSDDVDSIVPTAEIEKKRKGKRKIHSRSNSRNGIESDGPPPYTECCTTESLYDEVLSNNMDTTELLTKQNVRKKKQHQLEQNSIAVINKGAIDVSHEHVLESLQPHFHDSFPFVGSDEEIKKKPPTGKRSSRPRSSNSSYGQRQNEHFDDVDVDCLQTLDADNEKLREEPFEVSPQSNCHMIKNYERKSVRRRGPENIADAAATMAVNTSHAPVFADTAEVEYLATTNDTTIPIVDIPVEGAKARRHGRRMIRSRSSSRTRNEQPELDDNKLEFVDAVNRGEPMVEPSTVTVLDSSDARNKSRKRLVRSRSGSRCRQEPSQAVEVEQPTDDCTVLTDNIDYKIHESADDVNEAEGEGKRERTKTQQPTASRQEPLDDITRRKTSKRKQPEVLHQYPLQFTEIEQPSDDSADLIRVNYTSKSNDHETVDNEIKAEGDRKRKKSKKKQLSASRPEPLEVVEIEHPADDSTDLVNQNYTSHITVQESADDEGEGGKKSRKSKKKQPSTSCQEPLLFLEIQHPADDSTELVDINHTSHSIFQESFDDEVEAEVGKRNRKPKKKQLSASGQEVLRIEESVHPADDSTDLVDLNPTINVSMQESADGEVSVEDGARKRRTGKILASTLRQEPQQMVEIEHSSDDCIDLVDINYASNTIVHESVDEVETEGRARRRKSKKQQSAASPQEPLEFVEIEHPADDSPDPVVVNYTSYTIVHESIDDEAEAEVGILSQKAKRKQLNVSRQKPMHFVEIVPRSDDHTDLVRVNYTSNIDVQEAVDSEIKAEAEGRRRRSKKKQLSASRQESLEVIEIEHPADDSTDLVDHKYTSHVIVQESADNEGEVEKKSRKAKKKQPSASCQEPLLFVEIQHPADDITDLVDVNYTNHTILLESFDDEVEAEVGKRSRKPKKKQSSASRQEALRFEEIVHPADDSTDLVDLNPTSNVSMQESADDEVTAEGAARRRRRIRKKQPSAPRQEPQQLVEVEHPSYDSTNLVDINYVSTINSFVQNSLDDEVQAEVGSRCVTSIEKRSSTSRQEPLVFLEVEHPADNIPDPVVFNYTKHTILQESFDDEVEAESGKRSKKSKKKQPSASRLEALRFEEIVHPADDSTDLVDLNLTSNVSMQESADDEVAAEGAARRRRIRKKQPSAPRQEPLRLVEIENSSGGNSDLVDVNYASNAIMQESVDDEVEAGNETRSRTSKRKQVDVSREEPLQFVEIERKSAEISTDLVHVNYTNNTAVQKATDDEIRTGGDARRRKSKKKQSSVSNQEPLKFEEHEHIADYSTDLVDANHTSKLIVQESADDEFDEESGARKRRIRRRQPSTSHQESTQLVENEYPVEDGPDFVEESITIAQKPVDDEAEAKGGASRGKLIKKQLFALRHEPLQFEVIKHPADDITTSNSVKQESAEDDFGTEGGAKNRRRRKKQPSASRQEPLQFEEMEHHADDSTDLVDVNYTRIVIVQDSADDEFEGDTKSRKAKEKQSLASLQRTKEVEKPTVGNLATSNFETIIVAQESADDNVEVASAARLRQKRKPPSASSHKASVDEPVVFPLEQHDDGDSNTELLLASRVISDCTEAKKNKRRKPRLVEEDPQVYATDIQTNNSAIGNIHNNCGNQIQSDDAQVVKMKNRKKKGSVKKPGSMDEEVVYLESTELGDTAESVKGDDDDDHLERASKRSGRVRKGRSKVNFNNNNLSRDTSIDELASDLCLTTWSQTQSERTQSDQQLHHNDLTSGCNSTNDNDVRSKSLKPRVTRKESEIEIVVDKAVGGNENDGVVKYKSDNARSIHLNLKKFHPMQADLGDGSATEEAAVDVIEVPMTPRIEMPEVDVNAISNVQVVSSARPNLPRADTRNTTGPLSPLIDASKSRKSKKKVRSFSMQKVNRSMSYMETSFDEFEPILTSETNEQPLSVSENRNERSRRRIKQITRGGNRSFNDIIDDPTIGVGVSPFFQPNKVINSIPQHDKPEVETEPVAPPPAITETTVTKIEQPYELVIISDRVNTTETEPQIDNSMHIAQLIIQPNAGTDEVRRQPTSAISISNNNSNDSDGCPEPIFQRRQSDKTRISVGFVQRKSGDHDDGKPDAENIQNATNQKDNSNSNSDSLGDTSTDEVIQSTTEVIARIPTSSSGSAFRPVNRSSLSFEAVPHAIGHIRQISPVAPASKTIADGFFTGDIVTSSPISPSITASNERSPLTAEQDLETTPVKISSDQRRSRPAERTASGLSARSLSLGDAVSQTKRSSGGDVVHVPNRTSSSKPAAMSSSLSNRRRLSRQAKGAVVAAREKREAQLLRPLEVQQPEMSLQDAAFEMLSFGNQLDAPNGKAAKSSSEVNNNDGGVVYTRGVYRPMQSASVAVRRPSGKSSSIWISGPVIPTSRRSPSPTDAVVSSDPPRTSSPTTTHQTGPAQVTRRRIPRLKSYETTETTQSTVI